MGDLAQEARADARAFRENTVYTADGDPVRLTANSDRLDAYADRIEALEAENARLSSALSGMLTFYAADEEIGEMSEAVHNAARKALKGHDDEQESL